LVSGASGWHTFWRITLPKAAPAIIAGVAMATARAAGEFGAASWIRPRTERVHREPVARGERVGVGERFRKEESRIEEQHWHRAIDLGTSAGPSDSTITDTLRELAPEPVREAWAKALARRATDPAGAITSARAPSRAPASTFVNRPPFPTRAADLPKLYKLTLKALQLSPSDAAEPAMKQFLGGCASVVIGVAAIRNTMGDAHGSGAAPVRPDSRHAHLAVTIAGATAMFLVETWHAVGSTRTH
jgi:hypothetical protein